MHSEIPLKFTLPNQQLRIPIHIRRPTRRVSLPHIINQLRIGKHPAPIPHNEPIGVRSTPAIHIKIIYYEVIYLPHCHLTISHKPVHTHDIIGPGHKIIVPVQNQALPAPNRLTPHYLTILISVEHNTLPHTISRAHALNPLIRARPAPIIAQIKPRAPRILQLQIIEIPTCPLRPHQNQSLTIVTSC